MTTQQMIEKLDQAIGELDWMALKPGLAPPSQRQRSIGAAISLITAVRAVLAALTAPPEPPVALVEAEDLLREWLDAHFYSVHASDLRKRTKAALPDETAEQQAARAERRRAAPPQEPDDEPITCSLCGMVGVMGNGMCYACNAPPQEPTP